MTLEFLEIMEDVNRQTGPVEARDVAAKPQKPRKVRGWMTLHSDDSLEFRPSAEGTAAKVGEKKRGNSSFYRTAGEKESSVVAHLRVDASCEDPVAQMYEDLAALTKGQTQKEPPLPRSRKLMERPGVQVWHRQKEHKVVVVMEISTDTVQELSGQLFNLTSEVNKCFAINRTSLLRPRK